jgi:hypothetical protein
VRSARQRRWTFEEFSGPAVLALALLAFLLATLIDPMDSSPPSWQEAHSAP